MSAWLRAAAMVAALLVSAPAWASRPDDELRERIRATIAGLAAEGVAEPDRNVAPTDAPPPALAAAGEEFVAAWHEYRRALTLPSAAAARVAPTPADDAAAAEARSRLIARLLAGDDPPTPEEVEVGLAIPRSPGGCGTGYLMHWEYTQRAVLLADLLHRRFGDALRIQLQPWPGDADLARGRAELLSALGFDWRQVVAGAWLDGRDGMLESLTADPSDESAQMVLAWAERSWDSAVATEQTRRAGGPLPPGPRPELPTLALLHLLAAEDVSDDTKQHIADFLNVNATRLYDEAYWLRQLPPGAGRWVQPLARAALQHETNEVRRAAAAALQSAGDRTVRAEVRADPLYRVYLDGAAWVPPGDDGGVGIDFMKPGAGRAGSFSHRGDGVLAVNADDFTPQHDIRRAYIYHLPRRGVTDSPWFRAPIRLPPAYGVITDLHVDTGTLIIRPRFSRRIAADQLTEIGVEAITGDEWPPSGDLGSYVYQVIGAQPLVLTNLQRGRYRVRVRTSGAALGPWETVHVGTATVVRPTLEIGATLWIPVAWPKGIEEHEKHWNLSESVTVERDGQTVADAIRPYGPDHLVLAHLPTGRYRIRFHAPDGAPQRWEFAVTARSKSEITLKPLTIARTHRVT